MESLVLKYLYKNLAKATSFSPCETFWLLLEKLDAYLIHQIPLTQMLHLWAKDFQQTYFHRRMLIREGAVSV